MRRMVKLSIAFVSTINLLDITSCKFAVSNLDKKRIDKKLSFQNEFENNKIQKQVSLLSVNDEKYISVVTKENLIELNNSSQSQLNFNLNTIIKTKEISSKWRKEAKRLLKRRREVELATKRKKSITIAAKTISTLLIISGIVGAGIYLFKYNRDPLHIIESHLVDLGLKAFLKFKKIDIDFQDSFRNLIFYIFKENDSEDKKLISFFVGRIKEVILNKKNIKEILNEEEIKKWIKSFQEENDKKMKNDNPISYFLKMLEGNNGENILREFIKLLKKAFDNKDNLNKIPGFDKIKEFFEKAENTEGLLSTFTSLLAGLNSIKSGVDFIIQKGKDYLEEDKKGLITIWSKLIDSLRKIVNKGNFKEQFKDELENLYNFFYNIVKFIFKDKELKIEALQNNSGILGLFGSILNSVISQTLKITNIVTPKTIKEWIENYTNNQ